MNINFLLSIKKEKNTKFYTLFIINGNLRINFYWFILFFLLLNCINWFSTNSVAGFFLSIYGILYPKLPRLLGI